MLSIKAPAKVNIGLKVLPKRPDGYHSIESIFQTVRLYDTLDVSLLKEKKCEVHCKEMKLPEVNTLSATWMAFCSVTGIDCGVSVELHKKIPSGGGLGGGSSDGAALLKALSKLNGIELTSELKDAVASQVGSDVFFFLHCDSDDKETAAAIVTGRGEFVKKIEPRADLYFLLIFPEVHSSTKEAYGLVDNTYETGCFTVCPDLAELDNIYRRSPEKWTFANSFTSVLLHQYSVIGKALQDMKLSGALWSDMSGSGATVFGVFDSEAAVKEAYFQLQKTWSYCVIA